MTHAVIGVEGLRTLQPSPEPVDLGTTEPLVVDQDMINRFADATGDDQWIHVDEEAAAKGPFGTTIAHGYLTLSLIPRLLPTLIEVRNVSGALNYGANKVRFPDTVRVGSKLVMAASLTGTEPKSGGVLTTFQVTFQVEGAAKPACIAEVLYLYLP